MNEVYLSIDKAIEMLGLANAPKGFALNTVINLGNYKDGIRIYYSGEILGAEYQDEPEPILDSTGEVSQLLIAVGVAVVAKGRKRLMQMSFRQEVGQYFVAANTFEIGGVLHHCTEETGMFVDSVLVSLDNLFVIADEFDEFFEKASAAGFVTAKRVGSEPGARKALALLAREMADKSAKFRTGDKVNSRAVKDHIISLAEKYDVTPGKLANIDDKVSETLNELDLREVPKKPAS
jgi:hypothetical protein